MPVGNAEYELPAAERRALDRPEAHREYFIMTKRDTFEADFDFTVETLTSFFGQSRIGRSLATISDVE